MGFHMEANKKFKYDGELTEAALLAFAKTVVDGTAAADYKSAAIPEGEEAFDEVGTSPRGGYLSGGGGSSWVRRGYNSRQSGKFQAGPWLTQRPSVRALPLKGRRHHRRQEL
jgi:hypothetical protein